MKNFIYSKYNFVSLFSVLYSGIVLIIYSYFTFVILLSNFSVLT